MKVIGFLVTLTTVALAAVVYFASDEAGVLPAGFIADSGADVPFVENAAVTTEAASAPAASATALRDAGPDERGPADRLSPLQRVREMLEESRDQQGNMQAFFDALRKLCTGEGLDHAQCSDLLAEALVGHGDAAQVAMLQRIMERLPRYEATMQRTVMSTDTPPRQRYAVIDAQRRQLLGDAETELMFGQERALAHYRFAYGDLMEDEAASLAPEQRLQRLEQLQRQHFGEYEQALQQARGPHASYQQERDLLLLGVEDPQQREAITRQLREKHFDDETVASMQARDAELARQQAELAAYKADLAVLDAEMAPLKASLTEEQWQARYQQALRELRLLHFSD